MRGARGRDAAFEDLRAEERVAREGRIEGEDIHPLRFEVVHLPIRAGRPDNPQIWILGGIFFLD